MGARLIRHLLHKRHDLSTSLRSAQRQRFVATSTAARSEPPTIGRLTPPHTRAWGLWASAGAGAAAAAYLFGSRADSDAHQNGWPLSGGAAPPVLPGALGDGAVVATTSGSQHLSGVTQPSWVTEFAASQSLQVCRHMLSMRSTGPYVRSNTTRRELRQQSSSLSADVSWST